MYQTVKELQNRKRDVEKNSKQMVPIFAILRSKSVKKLTASFLFMKDNQITWKSNLESSLENLGKSVNFTLTPCLIEY